MAQYCHVCSLAILGKDQYDFNHTGAREPVTCSCCGPITTDENGVRLTYIDLSRIPTCDCYVKASLVQPENVLEPII